MVLCLTTGCQSLEISQKGVLYKLKLWITGLDTVALTLCRGRCGWTAISASSGTKRPQLSQQVGTASRWRCSLRWVAYVGGSRYRYFFPRNHFWPPKAGALLSAFLPEPRPSEGAELLPRRFSSCFHKLGFLYNGNSRVALQVFWVDRTQV